MDHSKFLRDCYESPEFYIENVMGAGLYEKQREICQALLDHRRVAISACYASGKTYLLGRLASWFYDCRPNSIVVVTSSSESQLKNALWAELVKGRKKAKFPLGGRIKSLEVVDDDDPKHYIAGVTTNDPERIRGRHPDSGYILVLVDEASGISRDIWDAIENLLNAEHAYAIAVTNPTKPHGPFYEAFVSGTWFPITISAFDTPNVIAGKTVVPGLCDPQWVKDRERDWKVGSNLYKTGVLGQFPDEGDDTLIPTSWIHGATSLEAEPEGERVAGVDISRGGSDECVFLVRQGIPVIDIKAWQEKDSMKTVSRIIELIHSHRLLPKNVWIDDGNVGGAVVDRLREEGFPVRTVSFGAAAKSHNDVRFTNRRTEIFWKLREQFEAGVIQIPKHPKLLRDLNSLRIERKSNGKLQLISKEKMKRMGFPSPDYADALAMASHSEHTVVEKKMLDIGDLNKALRSRIQPDSWKERLKGRKWKGIHC